MWDDGLMTIDGNGTTIHHNCTDGIGWDYGLCTYNSSSSIKRLFLFSSFSKPKITIYVSCFVNVDYRIGVVIATNVNARLL